MITEKSRSLYGLVLKTERREMVSSSWCRKYLFFDKSKPTPNEVESVLLASKFWSLHITLPVSNWLLFRNAIVPLFFTSIVKVLRIDLLLLVTQLGTSISIGRKRPLLYTILATRQILLRSCLITWSSKIITPLSADHIRCGLISVIQREPVRTLI